MKALYFSLAGLSVICGCSPDPSPCINATWTYEVTLQNTASPGAFLVNYIDGYGNAIVDTSITQIWTKEVTPFDDDRANGAWMVEVGTYKNNFMGGATNYATVNIYENGTLVKTSGPFQAIHANGNITIQQTAFCDL